MEPTKLKGRGVTSFTDDGNGNAWLYNPKLLKPKSFLDSFVNEGWHDE
jgi:hypothetical protein